MATRRALATLLLTCVVSAVPYTTTDGSYLSATTGSAFWTVTSRLVASLSLSPYTYYDGDTVTYTETSYRTVKSTATVTAQPTSTIFSSAYYDEDVDTLYELYPTGAIAESDLERDYYATDYSNDVTTTTDSAWTYDYFSMPVTMTAPRSCATQFTVTTSASVSIPTEVRAQVTAKATSSDLYSTTDRYGTMDVTATWYLTEGAAPWTSSSDYYYSAYVASCSVPPAYQTGSSGGGSSSSNDDAFDTCRNWSYWGCSDPWLTLIIAIVSIVVGLFFLGFIESWFWFRRLMMGKSAMRRGTVCWILIALWALCFTRMQNKRSVEDQKLLEAKWKQMPGGAKFKAWRKYGLRRRYPEEFLGQYSPLTVGIVPPGQPLHPALPQTPDGGWSPPGMSMPHGAVLYYGPPPSGFVPNSNGVYMAPQFPLVQQAGFFGDMGKPGTTISTSPIPPTGPPQVRSLPPLPERPEPAYAPATGPSPPSPPSQETAQTPTPASAPAPPNASASSSSPPSAPVPVAREAPQLPPVNVGQTAAAETPKEVAPKEAIPQDPKPHKNDPNDRDLYE